MTPDTFNIPPVHVEAQSNDAPPQYAYKSRPAQYWIKGDAIQLAGEVFRIHQVVHSKHTAKITFVLHPWLGGRPTTESFLPREWREVARGYSS